MKIQRICKICGKSFNAIKITQFFCCRKCFKKDYYVRNKIRQLEEERKHNYPTKKCSFCGTESKLNFDPIVNPQKFNAWGCPECGATNALVWEYQDNPNSYQLINNVLISVQAQIEFDTSPQYQVYHLPVVRPEQGNPAIVVLTCAALNILDIQRNNRKKILFS